MTAADPDFCHIRTLTNISPPLCLCNPDLLTRCIWQSIMKDCDGCYNGAGREMEMEEND